MGKSSLLIRLCEDRFSYYTGPTVGTDMLVKIFSIGDKNVKLRLWDTAGQER